MNLVRFGMDGAQIDVLRNSHGQWECRNCPLAERGENPLFNSNNALLSHLDTHLVKGQHVPEWVFEELEPKV